jgi:hypothetical protein
LWKAEKVFGGNVGLHDAPLLSIFTERIMDFWEP